MINIERVISKTPMVIADYFTEDGLLKQVGLVKEYWNRIVVKELTDNALDAIEPLQDKKVFMDVTSGSLGIYDNGTGIKKETVEDIYDFENYVSQNRNYITASRGKQGNGLKTIISICYIQGYRLLWHTAEGIILEANIDSEQLRYGRLEVSFVEIGVTDKRGIEIIGIGAVENFLYDYFIGYSKCNPDVSFYLNYFGEKIENLAKMEGIDKSKNISIAYYDYDSYQNFIIHTQDGNTTYKQFLDNVFGTRMKNKSNIKSKIKDIDFKSDEFIKDFLMLKEDQQTKKYTLLKKQLIGLENILTTTVEIVDNEAPKGMNDKVIPCIVEFSVKKDTFKNETAKKNSSIECYINNSITYRGAFSITFKSGWYKIGKYCNDKKPFVIHNEPGIEHIFSELYFVPQQIKGDYYKVKALELLLYLDALQISESKEERPYFYKGQVEKIKAIHDLITTDLQEHYTMDELAERFQISLTGMKNCFKEVYGDSMYSYLRRYRMNIAATMLRQDSKKGIAEIAGAVGYESPSKFATAFRQVMGQTPMEYRKSFF